MRLLATLVAGAHLANAAAGWGHSAVLLGETSTLFIQGGKVDTPGYTYTSAPNTAAAVLLPLNASFAATTPPLTALSGATGPDYAWGCIAPTAYDASTATWTFLAFGGVGGFASPGGADDSAWLLTLDARHGTLSATHPPPGWGSQPSRRTHVACAAYSTGGMVYITGGQSTADVGTPFASAYVFDPATSSFRALPDLPVALFHHMAVLLPNGILVVFGGAYVSPQTGMNALQTLSVVFTLDTTNLAAVWVAVSLAGAVPPGRRGASATVVSGSEIFVFGGADVTLQTAYQDGWVLDLAGGGHWTQVISTQGPSPRFDHTAAEGGNGQIIIYGGYPAPSSPGVDIIQVTPASVGSGSGTPPASPSAIPVPSYTPPLTPDSNGNSGQGTTNGGSGGAAGGLPMGVAPGGGGQATLTSMWLTTAGGGVSATSGSGDGDGVPSPTGTSVPPESQRRGLSPTQVAALATSVSLIGAALLGIFIWLCCFRRRDRYAQPDGSNEKELPVLPTTRALLFNPTADDDPWVVPKRSKMEALGVGISRVATTIRKVSGGPEADSYTRLPTGRPSRGLSRHSTRKVGKGIMLVGSTPDVMGADEFEDLPALTPMVVTDSARSRRLAMLAHEDVAVQRDPWAGISDRAIDRGSPDEWHPAHSLLSLNGSRFTSPPGTPMAHGPVPTPVESLRGGPPSTPAHVSVHFDDADPCTDDGEEAQSALEHLLSTRSASKYRLPDFAPGAAAPLGGDMGSLVSPSYRRSLDLSAAPLSNLPAGASSPPSRASLETSSLLASHGRASLDAGPTRASLEVGHRRPSLDAGSFLSASNRRGSGNTLLTPTSMTSSMELTEEAVITHARLVSSSSATASILNPLLPTPPTTASSAAFNAVPVLAPTADTSRSNELLRRFSGGIKDATRRISGISSPPPVPEKDMRDPAPQPSLWPLQLTGDSSERGHHDDSPSSDFTPGELFAPLRPIRLDSYASINTLGTARSMTDMTVVQRDHADNISAEVILDETGTPQSSVNSRGTFVTAHQSVASRNSRYSHGSIPRTPPRQVREEYDYEWEEEADELLHPEAEHLTPRSGRSALSGRTFGSVYTSASSTEVLPASSPPPSPVRQTDAVNATPRPLTPIPSTPPPRVSPGLVFATPPRVASVASIFHSPSPPRAASASTTPSRAATSSAPTTPSRLIPQVKTTRPPPSTPPQRPLPVAPGRATFAHAPSPTSSPISSPTKPLVLKRTPVTPKPVPAGTPPTSSPASGRNKNPRRPVKDVVASINRRGGGVPSLFDAPGGGSQSQSQSPTSSRSSTRFETVHKAPLKIANPDAYGGKE